MKPFVPDSLPLTYLDVAQLIREASGSRPAVLAFRELVNQAEGKRVL